MTMTHDEIVDKITGSAMLVSVSLGSYNPIKVDKSASRNVADTYGVTDRKAARVTKNTLPTDQWLDLISKVDTRIRAWVDKFTAPWARGIGLLAASNFFEFNSGLQALFDERRELVKRFVDAYLVARDTARNKLGGLFNPSDYPDESTVAAKFSCSLDVIPVSDHRSVRLNVLGEVADAVQAAMADTVTEKLSSVAPYVRELLLKPLVHMSAVLQTPEHPVYETTISNVLEAATQAEHLNLLGDDQIRNAVHEVREYLNVGKDQVKDNAHLRARVLSDCNRIIVSLDGEVPPPKKRTTKKSDISDVPQSEASDTSDVTPEPVASDNLDSLPDNPVVRTPDKVDDDKFPARPDHFNSDAVLAKLGW